MKQMEVTIMGQSYILGCPEGGEQSLLEAVGNVIQLKLAKTIQGFPEVAFIILIPEMPSEAI